MGRKHANITVGFSPTLHCGPKVTFLFSFFHLTYSRWTSSLPSCLWSQRIFPSLPGSRLTIFLSRCKFSTLTTRQPMVEFYHRGTRLNTMNCRYSFFTSYETVYYYYHIGCGPILFLFCFCFLSGVPAWRLM